MFQRERLNGHYGVASFVVANTLSSAPFLFLISALPGAIAYFLVDLHHGFDHFAYFVLTLYSCMLVVESLMMMVASIVPDFLLGIITGAGIQVHMGHCHTIRVAKTRTFVKEVMDKHALFYWFFFVCMNRSIPSESYCGLEHWGT